MDRTSTSGRRGVGRLLAAAAAGGLGLCLASLLVSGERTAGTGTHHWRGFPRSYLFSWEGFAGEGARSGFNAFYFLQNWVLWTAVASAALLLLRSVRSRGATP
ncbi:MAG TPA: hypothetical protein VF092_13310 [Longimicrobium sp.]